MGVKSSKHSYNVEQVGPGIKGKPILKKIESQEPQVPVACDTIIEEIISAAHIEEPKPRLSKEEQKKEEDLIIAKVTGELVSNSENSIVKEDNNLTNGTTNDLDAITVVKEEVSRVSPILTVATEQARVEEEKTEEKISEELQNFDSSKINQISSIPCTNEVNPPENVSENQTQSIERTPEEEQDTNVKETKTEEHVIPNNINEIPTSKIELNETPAIGTTNGEVEKDAPNVEKEHNNSVEEIRSSTEQNEVTCSKLEVPTCKKIENLEVIESQSEEKFKASDESCYNLQSIEKHSNRSEESCSTLRVYEESQTSNVNETENHQVAEISNSIEVSLVQKQEESVLTPKETYLKQISDTEKIVNGLKERILHFTGTGEDKEFSVLHEELIKHIIKLDDINFEDEEVKNERRRVIKMIQQSVQNLEKKIESSDDEDQHPTDSE